MAESALRGAHPILFPSLPATGLNLTVQGAGIRMQQTLLTAVEHGLSGIVALRFLLDPLRTIDGLNSPFVAPLTSKHTVPTTETSCPSTVELEDPESEVSDWGAASVDST